MSDMVGTHVVCVLVLRLKYRQIQRPQKKNRQNESAKSAKVADLGGCQCSGANVCKQYSRGIVSEAKTDGPQENFAVPRHAAACFKPQVGDTQGFQKLKPIEPNPQNGTILSQTRKMV